MTAANVLLADDTEGLGNVMEHFTDGDLFDNAEAPGLSPIQSLLDVQWGARRAGLG